MSARFHSAGCTALLTALAATCVAGPIVTGAGAGGNSHVKQFGGGTLAEEASFAAYGASYTGGVTVATGDVNGDGVADIITGTASGTSHVKVFSGADGSELRSFLAFGSFTGGINVGTGDLDRDGFSDIFVGAGSGGAPQVKVFSGQNQSELRSFLAYDAAFAGGVTVAGGDVDGDGYADIVTGAGAGGGPHVKVFSGQTGSETASFIAFDPAFTGGVFVGAGDLDADGRADLVTGAGAGAGDGPRVRVFDGRNLGLRHSFNPYDGAVDGGVRVALGDIDGDGRGDIVTAPGAGSAPLVKVFDGQTLVSRRAFFAYSPGFEGGVYVAAPVPEPATLLILGLGVLGLRRRKR